MLLCGFSFSVYIVTPTKQDQLRFLTLLNVTCTSMIDAYLLARNTIAYTIIYQFSHETHIIVATGPKGLAVH